MMIDGKNYELVKAASHSTGPVIRTLELITKAKL